MVNIEEQNYLDLMKNIIVNGYERHDRTGIGTRSIFGTQLRFNLENNTLPLLTTKKMFFKGIVEELLFFIRGETDTKKLEAKGVNIWKGNTSREFLDKRGLTHLPEGDMGKGYGFQWRRFGEHRDELATTWKDLSTDGVDQLQNAINLIKNDPNSRKIIVSAWNPQQLHEMALEPCHCFYQFYVNDGKLSLHWYQRSVDYCLGLPFNIASYAVLTHLIAKICDLQPGELIFSGGDTHIYNNHVQVFTQQLVREPHPFPKLQITKGIKSLKDIEEMSFDDFILVDYVYYDAIKAPMAV